MKMVSSKTAAYYYPGMHKSMVYHVTVHLPFLYSASNKNRKILKVLIINIIKMSYFHFFSYRQKEALSSRTEPQNI